MTHTASTPEAVSATVSLWVPRGEAGDLQDGIEGVLAAIEGVEDVDVREVTRMRPTWTDVRVTVAVRLAVALDCGEGEAALRSRLRGGFGVTDVEEVDVEDR